MFTVALFTIAKTWRQPKWSLADEWIKMWHIYTKGYHSAIKKNETQLSKRMKLSFAATQMDLEIITQTTVNQNKKDKYHMPLIHGI